MCVHQAPSSFVVVENSHNTQKSTHGKVNRMPIKFANAYLGGYDPTMVMVDIMWLVQCHVEPGAECTVYLNEVEISFNGGAWMSYDGGHLDSVFRDGTVSAVGYCSGSCTMTVQVRQ